MITGVVCVRFAAAADPAGVEDSGMDDYNSFVKGCGGSGVELIQHEGKTQAFICTICRYSGNLHTHTARGQDTGVLMHNLQVQRKYTRYLQQDDLSFTCTKACGTVLHTKKGVVCHF